MKELHKIKERRREEANFCAELQVWLKYNARGIYYDAVNVGPVEAKISYDARFNLKSGFKEHQLPTLINISRFSKGVFSYKISDIDALSRKPFDIVLYTNTHPLVALKWRHNGGRVFYLFNPQTFQNLINRGIKSITEDDAVDLCLKIGMLQRK